MISAHMKTSLRGWARECKRTRKNLDFTAAQFAEHSGRSVRTVTGALNLAVKEGLVIRLKSACRRLNRSAVYRLSDRWPNWSTFYTALRDQRKFSSDSLFLKEIKEGSTPTPMAVPQPENIPPEPKKEGFAWSPVSREEIREAVSLLVRCGVSVLGAKKAVNTAFNEKRLELAMEALMVAQTWVKNQPGIRNQAGFLQALVEKQANHLRFRDSLRQKSKPLPPAAGSVHRGGGSDKPTANGTAHDAFLAWQSLLAEKKQGIPDDLDREHAIGLAKERFTRIALSELGERGREIEAEVMERVSAVGLAPGLVTRRAIAHHLTVKVLQEMRIEA